MACWIAQRPRRLRDRRHAARPLIYRLAGRGALRAGRAARSTRRRDAAARHAPDPDHPVQPLRLSRRAPPGCRSGRFTWTTAVGYLPITAIFVYLGSQLEELSPTDPSWCSAVMPLAVARRCSRGALRRRCRAPRTDEPARDPPPRARRGTSRGRRGPCAATSTGPAGSPRTSPPARAPGAPIPRTRRSPRGRRSCRRGSGTRLDVVDDLACRCGMCRSRSSGRCPSSPSAECSAQLDLEVLGARGQHPPHVAGLLARSARRRRGRWKRPSGA